MTNERDAAFDFELDEESLFLARLEKRLSAAIERRFKLSEEVAARNAAPEPRAPIGFLKNLG